MPGEARTRQDSTLEVLLPVLLLHGTDHGHTPALRGTNATRQQTSPQVELVSPGAACDLDALGWLQPTRRAPSHLGTHDRPSAGKVRPLPG